MTSLIEIPGILGTCGHQRVFMGFASAGVLHSVSFADVLREDDGRGYQRPYNRSHSRDFREYILRPGTSTIPLTFNLRGKPGRNWQVEETHGTCQAILRLSPTAKCLVQVDCQHRLGELKDSDIPLAFMTFIGLDLQTEMSLFVIINSKARGLSTSLTDYHESRLLDNLAEDAPHLYIARRLNEDPKSPWYRMIRYGGETSSGLRRRTSFRMMQQTVARFLACTKSECLGTVDEKYLLIRSFWRSVKRVFPKEWGDHRHHLVSKGIGLYSLSLIASDIISMHPEASFTEEFFFEQLLPLRGFVDWSSKGQFSGIGGQRGVITAHIALQEALRL